MLITELVEVEELAIKIEQLRFHMNALFATKGFIDAEVVGVSQELDGLLNHYAFIKQPTLPLTIQAFK